MRNGEIKSPIIFSVVGSEPQIGIVPSFSNSIELNRQNERQKVTLADGEQSLEQQWADQEAAEYAKLTAQRAGIIEGLMLQDNWTNCHLLLNEWELERNPGVSEAYTDDFGITHREFPKEERINYSAIFSSQEVKLLELIWHSCPELQGDSTRGLEPNWEAIEAKLKQKGTLMTVTQEALIKRAVLSLYQIRVGEGKDKERIVEDCVADALKGKEDIELPGDFHDHVEEAALNGDVEAELRRLNALIEEMQLCRKPTSEPQG